MPHYNEIFIEMLHAERGASVNTIKAYNSDLDNFAHFLNKKNKNIDIASSQDIKSYIHHLSNNNIGSATTARHISSLRQFYNFIYVEGLRSDNPMDAIEAPKIIRPLPKILSIDEVDQLLSVANIDKSPDGIRLLSMIEILYATGLRVSELVQLSLSSVAHIKHNASINDSQQEYLIIMGKGNRERIVPLSKPARNMIIKYKDIRPYFLKTTMASKYLFPSNAKSGHLTRQRMGQLLKQLALTANIAPERVSPHILRHAFASHLLNNGADLRILQQLLGHVDISTTQIYTHILDEKLKQVINSSHPLAKE